VESVPGRIRVRLNDQKSAVPAGGVGLFSKLGLVAAKPVAARPLIDLELHMEKREVGYQTQLHITVLYKAPGGRSQAMMPSWRNKCDEVHRELRAYLMGRG
jgi:hypothetical protein